MTTNDKPIRRADLDAAMDRFWHAVMGVQTLGTGVANTAAAVFMIEGVKAVTDRLREQKEEAVANNLRVRQAFEAGWRTNMMAEEELGNRSQVMDAASDAWFEFDRLGYDAYSKALYKKVREEIRPWEAEAESPADYALRESKYMEDLRKQVDDDTRPWDRPVQLGSMPVGETKSFDGPRPAPAPERRPEYWVRKYPKGGEQYAVKQLHFYSKDVGLDWVRNYYPKEMPLAQAGWADDAPRYNRNIWADAVEGS